MRPSRWRTAIATGLVAMTLPVLAAPVPAVASTTLGGYTASATASVVRIQIFEPALPIPAEPQVDATIAFARSQTSTGPSSRALASYLWPGDTLGDGLGTLAGNDNFDYPVKVNSKYPETDVAPAHNTAQITGGNGMTTSADDTTTRATVTAASVGPDAGSGLGAGLCALLKQKCKDPALPAIPNPIAAVATVDAARSQSTVTLDGGRITALADTKVTGLSLLAGLISVDGLEMTSTSTSDGAKADTDGTAKVTGLRIAGKAIDLGNPVDVDGNRTPVPVVPIDLAAIGVKVDYLRVVRTSDAASSSGSVEGLTITVDASVLSKALHTSALTSPLNAVLDQIPTLGPLLSGLVKLGTKIVITVGDARSSSTASPAYEGGGPVTSPPVTGGTTATPGVVTPTLPGGMPVLGEEAPSAVVPGAPVTTLRPTSFQFPGLEKMSSLLLLGALALALLAGWLFRGVGAFFLGADSCALGASVAVPNLREG